MTCAWPYLNSYPHKDSFSIPEEEFVPLLFYNTSASLPQQTLPVDLSNSGVRSGGNSGASFHGSTSAFDPCCPGSTSRPPAYVSQATPGPSQPAVVDSFSSSMVAQPQPQTQPQQPCRHYMHPSCEYDRLTFSEMLFILVFCILKVYCCIWKNVLICSAVLLAEIGIQLHS